MNLKSEMNRIGGGGIAQVLQEGGASLSKFVGATRVDAGMAVATPAAIPVLAPGA